MSHDLDFEDILLLLDRARAAEQHKEAALRQKQRQQQGQMLGSRAGGKTPATAPAPAGRPLKDKEKDKDKEKKEVGEDSAVKFGKAFEFANTGFFRYSAHTLRNERAWV